MSAEIGARNFADVDRYHMLPKIGRCLGLDTTRDRSLWKDRALVELNLAVLHSFDFEAAGITLSDHHTESVRFLSHIAREERAGRRVSADWSWIVPPLSGGATAVFHRYYDTDDQRTTFVLHPKPKPWHEARALRIQPPTAIGLRPGRTARTTNGRAVHWWP